MSSVSVAMEERATQRAERRRKLEEAKQRREEEKLVREMENEIKSFTPFQLQEMLFLTRKWGTNQRHFIQIRSFIVCEKADVQHISKEVVIAAFTYSDSTNPAISQADTLCCCSCGSRSSLHYHPPTLLSHLPHDHNLSLLRMGRVGVPAEIHLTAPSNGEFRFHCLSCLVRCSLRMCSQT